VRALPYGDGELSGYISMGVVEHFSDEERGVILREAARCLRSGGVAIITVPYFSPARRVRAMVGGFARESGGLPENTEVTEVAQRAQRGRGELDFYQFFFTRREISGEIERAGMRVVGVDGYDCKRGFTDALGGVKVVDWLERRGGKWAKRVDHPARMFRRLCPHMLMLVAVKP
jgi:hypothetical protein